MSRNGSGVFILPTGNPVVPNTTITTTWANTTLNDIANGLTQSVAADGQTPMTGALNMNGQNIIGANSVTSTTGNFTSLVTSSFDVTGNLEVDGKLGVGTATPTSKLEVIGTGRSPTIYLTDSATIAWDTSLGQVASFSFLLNNRTMGAPTNLANGAFYSLTVVQGLGGNTLTWSNVFKWANGAPPVLSTGAGAYDFFVFLSDGVYLYEQGRSQAVS